MDFSAHQEAAKKRTVRLLLLYAAMLLGFSLVTGFVVQLSFLGTSETYSTSGTFFLAGVVLFALGGFTLFSPTSLNSGGRSVAEAMSASLITAPKDHLETRLLNVVDEMALASGIPVPPVYIMNDEPGINAFAAGAGISDAVIGVTRGALEHLSRDELQAVMGHEFSHILNGDMRMNMRFARLLFGMMFMADAGRMILRGSSRMAVRASSKKNGGVAMVVALGLICVLFGYVTAFMGKILQAAISRQREFLADASSVQFTRSKALCGALEKIAAFSSGSRLQGVAACADSYGHFFFCRSSAGLLDTHPPISERILRINPDWNGTLPQNPQYEESPSAAPPIESVLASAGQMGNSDLKSRLVAALAGRDIDGEERNALEWLQKHNTTVSLSSQPANGGAALSKLLAASREPLDSCLMMFALLLDDNPAMRQKQLATLGRAHTREAVLDYNEAFALVSPDEYVPLIELSAPALKTMSEAQYKVFITGLRSFIEADELFTFKEWVMYQIVESVVGAQFTPADEDDGWGLLRSSGAAGRRRQSALTLLAALALLAQTAEDAAKAFAAGAKALSGVDGALPPLPDRPSIEDLQEAMHELRLAPREAQDGFIAAARVVIEFDGRFEREEGMFLQTILLCLGRGRA